MKIYEALNILESLNHIKESTTEYPIKVGFKLYQNIQTLQKALKTYYLMRNDIIKKYSINGELNIGVENQHYQEVLSEIQELNQQEIADVNLLYAKLSDVQKMNIPMNEIVALSVMIKSENDV